MHLLAISEKYGRPSVAVTRRHQFLELRAVVWLKKASDLPEASVNKSFHVFGLGCKTGNGCLCPLDTSVIDFWMRTDFLAFARRESSERCISEM